MQITEVSIAAIVDRNKEEAHFKEVKRQNIGLCQSYANRWLKGERWLPILLKQSGITIAVKETPEEVMEVKRKTRE
jgi:hypothetical protein